ncbi:MAG TPA: palindromic element RPE4 domain-containing protein [Rickettsia endosymbiont of Degeeriella rufa]|nr:palindromic element RPE4 domain-containing protein [Rickettsia endosymbiont of Degeeriella rufa]
MPAWIVFPCHPVIYELEPVKNTNKISIFYYFLDPVVKPRYDTEGVFRSTQQCCHGVKGENDPRRQCPPRDDTDGAF